MAASRNSVSVVATRDIPMRADLPFGESCEYGGSNGSDTFLGPGVVVSARDRTDGVPTSDGRLSDSHGTAPLLHRRRASRAHRDARRGVRSLVCAIAGARSATPPQASWRARCGTRLGPRSLPAATERVAPGGGPCHSPVATIEIPLPQAR